MYKRFERCNGSNTTLYKNTSWLPGFVWGPLPSATPFLPPSLPPSPPPSCPPLPLSILGLPGCHRYPASPRIFVYSFRITAFPIYFLKLASNYYEILTSKIPHRGFTFFSICRQFMKFPGFFLFFIPKTSPSPWWGGRGSFFYFLGSS